jgi:hypothetical protein
MNTGKCFDPRGWLFGITHSRIFRTPPQKKGLGSNPLGVAGLKLQPALC